MLWSIRYLHKKLQNQPHTKDGMMNAPLALKELKAQRAEDTRKVTNSTQDGRPRATAGQKKDKSYLPLMEDERQGG